MKKRIVAGIVLPIAFFSSFSSSALATNIPLNGPTTEIAAKMGRSAIRNDNKRLRENKRELSDALKYKDESSIGPTKAKVDQYKNKLKADTIALRKMNKAMRVARL